MRGDIVLAHLVGLAHARLAAWSLACADFLRDRDCEEALRVALSKLDKVRITSEQHLQLWVGVEVGGIGRSDGLLLSSLATAGWLSKYLSRASRLGICDCGLGVGVGVAVGGVVEELTVALCAQTLGMPSRRSRFLGPGKRPWAGAGRPSE